MVANSVSVPNLKLAAETPVSDREVVAKQTSIAERIAELQAKRTNIALGVTSSTYGQTVIITATVSTGASGPPTGGTVDFVDASSNTDLGTRSMQVFRARSCGKAH